MKEIKNMLLGIAIMLAVIVFHGYFSKSKVDKANNDKP